MGARAETAKQFAAKADEMTKALGQPPMPTEEGHRLGAVVSGRTAHHVASSHQGSPAS